MLPVGQGGGGHGSRANPSSSSNPLVALESYDFAYLLTMENYNDSDDTSFEDLNRACRNERKFIDGSLPFFFNEEAEEEEEEQQNYEDPSTRTRKSSGSINVLFGVHIFECFNTKNCSKRTY